MIMASAENNILGCADEQRANASPMKVRPNKQFRDLISLDGDDAKNFAILTGDAGVVGYIALPNGFWRT